MLQSLLHGDVRSATKLAGRLQDIFGRDNFFIELQDHGLRRADADQPAAARIAKEIQAPLLATNDWHYTDRADAASHDALLCVQTNATMDDPNRFHFHGDEHYFKSAAEMRQLFKDVPEACDNSLWIAERANVTIDFDRAELPEFPLPDGLHGRRLVLAPLGLRRRARALRRRAGRVRSPSASTTSCASSARWASPPTSSSLAT